MARDKNATIQQHQPLRTPEGWNKQEKMLLVQLDEILDDIYRRFGRLKLTDMSEAVQNGITIIDETTGKRVMIAEAVSAIDIKIADAEESIAEISATADRIETRISELGYGMVFMQPDEPEVYSKGDIWIQTLAAGDWQHILDNFSSWQDLLDGIDTWQVVGGIPKMFVYDGQAWVEMYDAEIQTNVMTQIEQLRDLIALRATVDDLNLLTGQVTEHSAELAIMAQQITQAVSTVNAKPSHYVQLADPRLTNEVHLGDTWTKHDIYFKTWQTIKGHYNTWQEVKDSHDVWMDGLGDRSFTWDGIEWVETSDKATEIVNRTRITETDTKIALMAVQQAQFQGDLIDLEAQITITATQIRQYVANNYYGMQSGIDILAAGIEISAAKYLKIKTGGVFTTESGNFSIDAQGNATFKGGGVFSGSLSAATGTFAGTLSATCVTSGTMSADRIKGGTLALGGNNNTDGVLIIKNASGTQIGKWDRDGINTIAGVIGGWTLAANRLRSGSSTGYVGLDSNTNNTYAMWAGAEDPANAPWRVTRGGNQTVTSLTITGESGTDTQINLKTYGLWKLYYDVIKSITVDQSTGGVTLVTSRETVNFNTAASVYVEDVIETAAATYPNTDVPVDVYLSNGKVTSTTVSCDGSISTSYTKGHDDGYYLGFQDGYDNGQSEGYYEGYYDGFDDGIREFQNLGNPGQLYYKSGNNYVAWNYPRTLYARN